jgi:predicted RNA-binding Zn ribbon-like protein
MSDFDYSSGSLCLDLANTWGNRSDAGSDRLLAYGDLLVWARGAGVVGEREHAELDKMAHREATRSFSVFRSAVELRDVVYRLCSATASGEKPRDRDVAALNAALQTVPKQRLCCSGECCEWEWPAGKSDLRQVLWPVIQSAADLVTSPDVSRIRECGAPDCNWLFLDRSRGGRRRWCDMSTCGNRAKARRYYERHRGNMRSFARIIEEKAG